MDGVTPARISIDTRTLAPGEIYYALAGERCDGHDFVEEALARGASRAVVATQAAGRYPAELRPRLELVEDPLTALQQVAQQRRRAWGGPLLAVTGSAGKTTTKDMLAAALATRYRVLKTEGNRNNHVGVPLTLLRLEAADEAAVVEMGMNHAGEIARLAAVAEPNVGVFTNVGTAHVGNFASIEGVAAAKRELAAAIPPSGALVLNADDARVARFGDGFAGRVVRYRGADFRGALLYAGRHHRANAAAAVAAAGGAAAAIALTAEYTKTREQFDRPIATFQAVGQRAADAYVDSQA
ncbi:MAG: Mur ligase family protein, partial [Terriglobales bacterium]